MKKLLLFLFILKAGISGFTQNGLESIYVERYYVTDATDSANSHPPLPVGSVTYRIYADLLPGYKVQTVFGEPSSLGSNPHPLTMTTTTEFFNQSDYGATIPTFSATNAKKNTVMIDSWLSTGGACTGWNGILKTEDNGLNNFVNSNSPQLLQNNAAQAGIPLTSQDGMWQGSVPSTGTIGLDDVIGVFGDGSENGNSFVVTDGAWFCLSGAVGPTAANKVLIAQITTNGIFHFELNIQIGTPSADAEQYVYGSPNPGQITIPSLVQTFYPVPQLPQISVTSPINSSSYSLGNPMVLAANATDMDGTITQVEFFVDGVSAGIDASSPYTMPYIPSATGPHVVTATALDNDNQTTTSAPVNFTVTTPAPVVFIVTGGGSYCQGSPGIAVGLSGSQSGVTYTLFKDNVSQFPTVGGTGSAISFGNQLAGTYTVEGTNAGGTTAMTGQAVNSEALNVPVSVAIIESTNNVCDGTSVTYTATPLNGGISPSYQWKVNGSNVGINSPTYNYIPANNDLVSVVLTSNMAGCLTGNPATSNVITMNIIQTGAATVSVVVDNNSVCGGQSVTFTATPVNGGTPSYQWYKNGISVGTNQNTYSYIPANNDQVYVIMTSSLSCATGNPATSNTITMVVTTPLVPAVTVNSSANPVCSGTSVAFTATPFSGGTPVYQWFVNSAAVGTNSNEYIYTPANNDHVHVQMTSSLTCITTNPVLSADQVMTVYALPVPGISGPVSACINSTGHVYSTETGKSNYLWTVSAGGVITSGGSSSDNTATISWIGSGSQWVKVNYADVHSCSALIPSNYNVTVNPLPVPVISGPAQACSNVSGNVYTTQAGMSNYSWVVPATGTITAGGSITDNTVTITWTTVGSQQISVNYVNPNSCTATTSSTYDITVNGLPAPTLGGPSSVCAFTTGNVYTTEAGNSNYVWNVSAGGTITSGGTSGSNTATITWHVAGNQTVSVNYANSNNCNAAIPVVYTVDVNSRPLPVITGPNVACINSTSNVYTTESGMTNYVWTLSPGAIITSGGSNTDNTITLTWTTSGTKAVSVNYANPDLCNAINPSIFNVNVSPLPVPTISGETTAGLDLSFVYTTETGMSNYQWIVSAGGSIISGGGATDNTVTILWIGTGSQTVSVNYISASGCTAINPTVLPVNVISTPGPAGSITGTSALCSGTTGVNYSVAPIANATGYIWTLPAGASIVSGNNTNSIIVDYAINAVSGAINVYGVNPFGNGVVSPDFNVTVLTTPVPTITGEETTCIDVDANVYSTQQGFSDYVWTISTGGTITSGAGTNSITVDWNTIGDKTVSVNYSAVSGCIGDPANFNVSVGPTTSPTIQGLSQVCSGAAGVVYTTEAGYSNYVWIVSFGGQITSGANTNAITVTWNTAGQRTVQVSYENAQGCGFNQVYTLNVNVVLAPVPVINGDNSVCQGETGLIYSTQGGFSNYNWIISGGGTITAGLGTAEVTVNWNTTGSQSLSVNYQNAEGCSAAQPAVINVTVNPKPSAAGAITGQPTLCAGSQNISYAITPVSNATSYNWTLPIGASIVSGANTNSIIVDFAMNATSGIIKVHGVNDCGNGQSSPDYSVLINPVPQTPVITQHGDTLVSSSNSGNQWYLDGVIIPGATSKEHIAVYAGTYSVVVTLYGCSSATSNTILVLPVSIQPELFSFNFDIYPNPSQGLFDVKIYSNEERKFNIEVHDALGNLISKEPNVRVSGNYIMHFNLSEKPAGVYTICFISDGLKQVRKFILMK